MGLTTPRAAIKAFQKYGSPAATHLARLVHLTGFHARFRNWLRKWRSNPRRSGYEPGARPSELFRKRGVGASTRRGASATGDPIKATKAGCDRQCSKTFNREPDTSKAPFHRKVACNDGFAGHVAVPGLRVRPGVRAAGGSANRRDSGNSYHGVNLNFQQRVAHRAGELFLTLANCRQVSPHLELRARHSYVNC